MILGALGVQFIKCIINKNDIIAKDHAEKLVPCVENVFDERYNLRVTISLHV